MAGFDSDVFGGGGSAFDSDVFGVPVAKPKLTRQQIQTNIANDPITKSALAVDGGEGVSQHALNLLLGGLRGAGSLGDTLLQPIDSAARTLRNAMPQSVSRAVDAFGNRLEAAGLPVARSESVDQGRPTLTGLVTGQQPQSISDQRRAAMTAATQSMGADPESMTYKGGQLGTEIAGTLGVGGAIAAPFKAAATTLPRFAPALRTLGTALESGGLSAPGATGITGLGLRMGAGGITGGFSAGLVDPNTAGTGFLTGAVLPPVVKGMGVAGQFASDQMRSAAERLMQSAIKPTLKQLQTGEAKTAAQVLLERGLSPNARGVEKLGSYIDDVDNQISGAIAGSGAQVDKQKVLQALNDTRQRFAQQATPQADLAAIQNAEQAFLQHPMYSGATIPVQGAQDLKRGTYQVLSKKYGQLGSADTEAQKAIARGLKDEIAAAVPEVTPLNQELARLVAAKKVAERRALMEGNKNPFGLASLSPSPAGFAAFLADRSAALKALGARGLYSAAPPVGNTLGLLNNPNLLPYTRGGLLAIEANP